jgi:hypothetical protein
MLIRLKGFFIERRVIRVIGLENGLKGPDHSVYCQTQHFIVGFNILISVKSTDIGFHPKYE